MVFMVLQGQFLNRMKILQLLIVFVLITCSDTIMVIDAIENESLITTNKRLLYYKNKPFTGELVAYYDGNKTYQKLSCYYLNGEKNGVEKKWHSNEKISSIRTYSKNCKVGIHQGWWRNGNKKFEYVFNDEGAYVGVLLEWFESGNLYRKFNYVNGKEEGSQKMWKPNGDIRANYVVKSGERFGLIGMKKCDPVATN